MTLSESYITSEVFVNILRAKNAENQLLNLKSQLSTFKTLIGQPTQNIPSDYQSIVKNRIKIESDAEAFLSNIKDIVYSLNDKLPFTLTRELIDILESLRSLFYVFFNVFPSNVGPLTFQAQVPNYLSYFTPLETAINRLMQYHSLYNIAQDFNSDEVVIIDPSYPESLSIIYDDEGLIKTLPELATASKEWGIIVNCFARLVNENNTEAEVLSIKRGSLIIIIGTATSIIGAIALASEKIKSMLLSLLDAKEKLLEFRKNKIFAELNMAEADKKVTINIKQQAKEITQELLDEFIPDKNNPDYHEIKTAVTKAVKLMITFENSGGRIDAKLMHANPRYKEIVEGLKSKNERYKLQRNNLRAIEQGQEFLRLEESNEKEEEENPEINVIS
jgi:hypothetical protein